MTFSDLLPRAAVILLLLVGAVFTYFESIYLQDQAAEIGRDAAKIVVWMWVFRLICLAFTSVVFLLLLYTVRRYMNPG